MAKNQSNYKNIFQRQVLRLRARTIFPSAWPPYSGKEGALFIDRTRVLAPTLTGQYLRREAL